MKNFLEKQKYKIMKDLQNGDFIYILNVNKDPMIILDCIIQSVFTNGPGISSIYSNKFKIILPDGSIRYFYSSVPNISFGKFEIYDIEYPDLDYDKGDEYFICTDRDYLIDEYINNSKIAIDYWETIIKNYTELLETEKKRILYIEQQKI